MRRRIGDRDPIGQEISFWDRTWSIVGVVGNVKLGSLHSDDLAPFVYVPMKQAAQQDMTFFLRTQGNGLQWAGPARQALWDMDPGQPILSVDTMDQRVQNSVSVERFCTILLSIMAGVALFMALFGLYGVMTFAINERSNEIGIRVALGAERLDILLLVTKKALVLAIVGLVVGLAGALAVSHTMGSMLYGISAWDPGTFVLIPILLFAITLLACYLPARRATRIDPVEALRYE